MEQKSNIKKTQCLYWESSPFSFCEDNNSQPSDGPSDDPPCENDRAVPLSPVQTSSEILHDPRWRHPGRRHHGWGKVAGGQPCRASEGGRGTDPGSYVRSNSLTPGRAAPVWAISAHSNLFLVKSRLRSEQLHSAASSLLQDKGQLVPLPCPAATSILVRRLCWPACLCPPAHVRIG